MTQWLRLLRQPLLLRLGATRPPCRQLLLLLLLLLLLPPLLLLKLLQLNLFQACQLQPNASK